MSMLNKENLPPAHGSPYISRLSPNNKPALSRQRDHSACRRSDTPLKVRKTRENLKQQSLYDSIPPPCVHASCNEHQHGSPVNSAAALVGKAQSYHPQDVPTQVVHGTPKAVPKAEQEGVVPANAMPAAHLERRKSVSRRMLSRVKQSIGPRSKSSQFAQPNDSETSLMRRLSGRRKYSHEVEQRAHSFEISRTSVDSNIDETPESLSNVVSSEQRSVTASTVSTAELLGPHGDEGLAAGVPEPSEPSSPALNSTPRPPPRNGLPPDPPGVTEVLQVPCIDLCVSLSHASVDLHSKYDVWVAIEATVRSMASTFNPESIAIRTLSDEGTGQPLSFPRPPAGITGVQRACGVISTLRLCYKPVGGCSIREIIGQRSVRDLAISQQCHLFVKVHVPRLRIKTQTPDLDSDSLFAELESIMGTLKTEILHVEARYRHTLLPSDNVVTVRHTCKIKRPEAGSRWSLVGSDNGVGVSSDVHVQLARHIATRYSAMEALDMLEQHLDSTAADNPSIRQLRESLSAKARLQLRKVSEDPNPSVVVTDSELDNTKPVAPSVDQFDTAPTTPSADDNSTWPRPQLQSPSCNALSSSTEHSRLLTSTPPIIPTRKTAEPSHFSPSSEQTLQHPPTPDSARQLWQHIRRSSLSAQQLSNITNDGKHLAEQGDEAVRALHRQAIANKRSVGAETLRAWKWDQSMLERRSGPAAPWM